MGAAGRPLPIACFREPPPRTKKKSWRSSVVSRSAWCSRRMCGTLSPPRKESPMAEKKDTPLPTAHDLAQALDAWRAGMGRLRPFLQLDEVVSTVVTAARNRDEYARQAEAKKAELQGLTEQIV